MAIGRDKCLVVDIDGTLCSIKQVGESYADLQPHWQIVARLRELQGDGFRIILHSSRNMRTYDGNLGEINANTLRPLLDWLDQHEIPYDEIHMGKPWAGHRGFYVDDRAVRPDEFLSHDIDELERLIDDGRSRLTRLNSSGCKGRTEGDEGGT